MKKKKLEKLKNKLIDIANELGTAASLSRIMIYLLREGEPGLKVWDKDSLALVMDEKLTNVGKNVNDIHLMLKI